MIVALYSEQDGKRWITFHASPDLRLDAHAAGSSFFGVPTC